MPLSTLCDQISMHYGLGLLAVNDAGEMNAVDRAFCERTRGFWDRLASPTHMPDTDACTAVGSSTYTAVLDENELSGLLEAVLQHQEQLKAAREQRIANLSTTLARRRITADDSDLTYYAGGVNGPVVVLLNALGQGLQFWHRLIDELMETHRVIIWEPRGTVAPGPTVGLAGQVDDLDAVLRNESIQSCHLVGWCTGPKVAIDFYLRRPEVVRSLAFLNGAFKCDGGPEEFNSPYLQNLEFLLRGAVRKPAMAATIMKTFQASPEESETDALEGADAEQMSVKVFPQSTRTFRRGVDAIPDRRNDTEVRSSTGRFLGERCSSESVAGPGAGASYEH